MKKIKSEKEFMKEASIVVKNAISKDSEGESCRIILDFTAKVTRRGSISNPSYCLPIPKAALDARQLKPNKFYVVSIKEI